MKRVSLTKVQTAIYELNKIRLATGRQAILLDVNKYDEHILTVDGKEISFAKKHTGEMLEQVLDITRAEHEQKVTGNLQVYNAREFAAFIYDQHDRPGFQLGEVVFIFAPDQRTSDDYSVQEDPKIGVIIQTHEDGDFRTDMSGNGSNSEVRHATLSDVKLYRPDLLKDLRPTDNGWQPINENNKPDAYDKHYLTIQQNDTKSRETVLGFTDSIGRTFVLVYNEWKELAPDYKVLAFLPKPEAFKF